MNTHIRILKVWLKSVLSLLKYGIFSRDCFSLAHYVYGPYVRYAKLQNRRSAVAVIKQTSHQGCYIGKGCNSAWTYACIIIIHWHILLAVLAYCIYFHGVYVQS